MNIEENDYCNICGDDLGYESDYRYDCSCNKIIQPANVKDIKMQSQGMVYVQVVFENNPNKLYTYKTTIPDIINHVNNYAVVLSPKGLKLVQIINVIYNIPALSYEIKPLYAVLDNTNYNKLKDI